MFANCLQAPAGPIKIVYFPVRAKTETLKLILSAGKIAFEETSLQDYYQVQSWPEAKVKTPFGQLPIMTVGDTSIAQTGAQNRYAAKLAGLIPADALDAAYCDSIYEAAMEMSNNPSNINPIVNVFTGACIILEQKLAL